MIKYKKLILFLIAGALHVSCDANPSDPQDIEIRTEVAKGGLDSFNFYIYLTGDDYYDSCVKDVKI